MEQVIINRRKLSGDIHNYIQTLESNNNLLESRNISLKKEIEELEKKLHLALFKKFGISSEKMPLSQIEFFETTEDTKGDNENNEVDVVIVASHPRKKPGRKPLDTICHLDNYF
ncbi:MAG: transposase [Spirochaetales bacterium]|nr:transposase [Spirochaetales bacterium]